jgi:phage protein D
MQRIIAQTPATTETIADEPVFSKKQAEQKALGVMRNQQKLMVTAKGKTIGLPDLRAGKYVELADLGARLSGKYLVTGTTHTFDSSGYTTGFDARLEEAASR